MVNSEAAVTSPNAWMDEWKSYINTREDVPEGMGIVRWWGVSISITSMYFANTCNTTV